MSLQELISQNIVMKFEGASLTQIKKRLNLAYAHLNNASEMFKKNPKNDMNKNLIIYKEVYDAMRIAAEAYLLSKGCKAVKEDHHKQTIKATADLMKEESLEKVFIRWDKMRKVRNTIDYDIDTTDVSNQSIEQSLKDAKNLLNKIEFNIEKKSSQAKLKLFPHTPRQT